MLPSGEFVPSATLLGIPWNWAAICLESLGISRLSARIDVATLVWYNTRPPGFYLPRAFVREPNLYHPVFRVCVPQFSADSPSGSTSPPLSGNTRPPGFYLPRVFSREPYLYYPVFRVCVCDSLKTLSRRVFLCLVFREQIIPAGIVFIFVREPYLYHPVFRVCV